MPNAKTTVQVTYTLDEIQALIAKDQGINPDEVNWIKDVTRSETYPIGNFETDTRYHFDGIQLEFNK